MRSRRNASNDRPDARAISTPSTSEAVWYSHCSPGWWTSGNVPSRRIHSSGERFGACGPGARPASAIAFWIGYRSGGAMMKPKPGAERQQVAQGDRALRGHGVVERRVEPRQHAAIRELGQERIDRLVEPEHALLDEDQRRHGRHRLRHRGDPEDGVARHRVARAQRLQAERVDARLAAPVEQRDEPGDSAALHVPRQDVTHAAQARLRESAAAHSVPSSRDYVSSMSNEGADLRQQLTEPAGLTYIATWL